MKTLPLLAGTLLAASLTGCDSADRPLPGHTRAWLRDAHGTTLRFGRPGTTATEEVRVERVETNNWHTHPGKRSLGGYHQEAAELRYLSVAAGGSTGLLVEFNATGRLYLGTLPNTAHLPPLAEVLTSDNDADELATSMQSQATVELLTNAALNGRTYSRVVHLHVLNAPSSTDLQDYWYSKADGLVAYTTAAGQTWYRR